MERSIDDQPPLTAEGYKALGEKIASKMNWMNACMALGGLLCAGDLLEKYAVRLGVVAEPFPAEDIADIFGLTKEELKTLRSLLDDGELEELAIYIGQQQMKERQ